MKFFSILSSFVLTLAAYSSVSAQTPPTGAGSGNPAVAAQRVEKLGGPSTPISGAGASVVSTASLAIDGATAGDETRFHLKKIEFVGAEQLPQDQLRRYAAVLEGKEVTLGQMNILARRVRLVARKAGLLVAVVRVPPQEITDGVVRIVVTPGKYGQVKVSGARHYSEEFVRRFFSMATAKGFVDAKSLYHSLLILNEYPDIAVQARFVAGRDPGTSDVLLQVRDSKPVHTVYDYNNFGSRLVGRNRAGATLTVGNAFTQGDEFLIRLVDSWPGRSHIFTNAGYTLPINTHGTRLSFQFADAETHVRGRGLDALDIRGDANIYSMVATHPWVRTFTQIQNLSATLAAKSITNAFFGDQLTSVDELRTLTLATDGARGDRLGRWIYNIGVSLGLNEFLGGKPIGAPLNSRVGAGNEFTKLTLDVLRNHDLKKNRYLLIRSGFQLSTEPLLTAEQYGIGGPDSVRGFIQSEALGDEGYTISAEYRHEVFRSKKGTELVQAVAFLDHGHVELKLPQVGEVAERSLTGAGAGLRAAIGPKASLRLDVGFPISQSRNTDGDDMVLYLQTAMRF